MVELSLVVLAGVCCLILIVLTADWIMGLRQRFKYPSTTATAEFMELKAYTHESIHDLRNRGHEMQLNLEAKSAALAERLARLEVKIDDALASQLETMTRILKLVEAQTQAREVRP